MAIKGITYDNQGPSAAAHGEFFSSTHADGILNGCELSYLGDTLTIAAGRIVSAGRLSELQAAETITVSAASGVARVLLQTDLSQEATRTSFKQLSFVVQTVASVAALPALVQEDINSGSGVIFQSEICTLQLGSSGIEKILSRMGKSVPFVRTESVTPEALSPAVKNLFLRPNILDNWYFGKPVNQRGKTSYTGAGYTIDRWAASSGSVTVAVEEGGIRVSAESGSWQNINQAIELPSRLNGKTVTLSAFVETNHHIVLSLKNVTTNVKYEATIKNPSGVVSLTYDVAENFAKSGDVVRFYVYVTTSTSEASNVMLKAVKLELGDTQTLAHRDADGNWQLNEIPSYGPQLENCRRYYQRLPTHGTYALPLAFGYMTSTTAGRVGLPLPTPMRDTPTMTAAGVKFTVKSVSSSVALTATPTVFRVVRNIIYFSFTTPEALNTNAVATLCFYSSEEATNHYIELSADL